MRPRALIAIVALLVGVSVVISPVGGRIRDALFTSHVELASSSKPSGSPPSGSPPSGASSQAVPGWRRQRPYRPSPVTYSRPLTGLAAEKAQQAARARFDRLYGLNTQERRLARAVISHDAQLKKFLHDNSYRISEMGPWTQQRYIIGAIASLKPQRLISTNAWLPQIGYPPGKVRYRAFRVHLSVRQADQVIVWVDFRRKLLVNITPFGVNLHLAPLPGNPPARPCAGGCPARPGGKP